MKKKKMDGWEPVLRGLNGKILDSPEYNAGFHDATIKCIRALKDVEIDNQHSSVDSENKFSWSFLVASVMIFVVTLAVYIIFLSGWV